jgi:O-methyltransferase
MPNTKTSAARLVALLQSIDFIVQNRIPGAIVECGVWRGGSIMASALALLKHGDVQRDLFLYDTFEGMSAPTSRDKTYDGKTAADQLRADSEKTEVWCYASLDEVKRNVLSTKYPSNKVHFVQGKVEDTIPGIIPEQIAMLRLDTDFYESTKHELTYLYPRLSKHGVLIVDDYGHWQGARAAVDEFFMERKINLLLHRIDYSGRIALRIEN